MIVGDHQLYPREAPALEAAKQVLVGGFALGVGDIHGYYLPKAVIPYRLGDQHPLAYDPRAHPDLLVASVHEQVGIGVGL